MTAANDETPLLSVLRDTLGLMGTRFGCGLEQCGCCMVLIDGAPVKSCTRAVVDLAGKSVITIEGLGTAEHPHPLAILQNLFEAKDSTAEPPPDPDRERRRPQCAADGKAQK